jgi:hypothetical protein
MTDYPIGTKVVYTRDDGSELITTTTDRPRTLGGVPVVGLAGLPGVHALERIRGADLSTSMLLQIYGVMAADMGLQGTETARTR